MVCFFRGPARAPRGDLSSPYRIDRTVALAPVSYSHEAAPATRRRVGMASGSNRRYNPTMAAKETFHHRRLACGIEFAAVPIDGRRTTTFYISFLAGMAHEPADRLGLTHLVNETIDKGTEDRSGRELTDAFDAIGAQQSSRAGREAFAFSCNCLPEYTDAALALCAEMLRRPTFPEDSCGVAIDLARQELVALEDEPDELVRRLMARQAYGERLGRHALGTRETLERIGREDIVAFWRTHFAASRMQVAAGGAVDADRFADALETHFAEFGSGALDGPDRFPVDFSPGRHHHEKTLEQEYILMGWPGVEITDEDYAIEEVMLGVLSGGMSSRLFTEVREKQGLVYWVGAWNEHPRGTGMLFMGASTMPARCDQTFDTLLREVDRLAEDITEEELARAKVGIVARRDTHGDTTSSRVAELLQDLFHFRRPVPHREKIERILAVKTADVRRYLEQHPRDRLSVVTLGTRALGNADGESQENGVRGPK